MESEEQRLRVHEKRGLGPNLASMIQFAPPSTYPMLDNTVAPRAVMEREALEASKLLLDDSKETELERCRGGAGPAARKELRDSLAGAWEADQRPGLETAAWHVLPMRRACEDTEAVLSSLAVRMYVGAVARGAGADLAHDTKGAARVPVGTDVVLVHLIRGRRNDKGNQSKA